MSREFSWGRDVFGLALAIQNLLWGMGQPFAGAIADRFGSLRVIMAGALMYAAGLITMRYAATPLSLDLGAGVLIGFGLSGCSFNLVLSAFGKLLPPEWRGVALGAGTAAGSFGQFVFAPFGVAMLDNFGWQPALIVFACLMLLVVPLSLALATPTSESSAVAATDQQTFRHALAEAFGHRSYVLLVLGFFTCGFQLAFITVHLPAYMVDRGMPVQTGGWVIAVIGLFNIIGSLSVGWLQSRLPKRYILSAIYFARAMSIVAFISFPITTFSAIAFGVVTGLTWLSTVPPTSSLVALMFGTRWLATLYGFAFFSHQVGGFLGFARRYRVREIRVVHADLVVVGAVRPAVGADQPADRRSAGDAAGCATGIDRSRFIHQETSIRECVVGTFRAIRIDKAEKGTTVSLTQFDEAELMEGDVTIRVEWSTLNYKDGLAVTGKAPVVRRFPMIAGIDLAGTVEQSSHPQWKAGDKVICNGWGMGETHLGAYAEKARVKGDWLVRLPEGMSARDAMAIGTAGYTAMLSVLALEKHGLTPKDGPIVVTGAAGGVGSVATAVLSKLGYHVIASTGRVSEAAYLKSLGAAEVIDRAELSGPAKPLAKERWAGGIDSVGSTTLANLLSMTKYRGAIAACGLAAGMDLPSSVAPFILRGVCLLGIDSVMCPIELRKTAWSRLAGDLDRTKLAEITHEIDLDGVVDAGAKILAGQVRGRIVVKIL